MVDDDAAESGTSFVLTEEERQVVLLLRRLQIGGDEARKRLATALPGPALPAMPELHANLPTVAKDLSDTRGDVTP